MERIICLSVNEELYEIMAGYHESLFDILRNVLGPEAMEKGCDDDKRDTFMVIMGEVPVNAHLVQAAEADGKEIITMECLEQGSCMDPMKSTYAASGKFQRGLYALEGSLL